jgi:acetyltransferase-like isoleucine patch superfamily enzyme
MPKITENKIRDVKFGVKCKIIQPVNSYECKLGDNVFVGPFVEICKGVSIGKNTRISSHSYICSKVTIGKNCFIGHGVIFTNDKFLKGKINRNENNWLKTKIDDHVLIGSNSTILPIKICKNVVIGAGSVVTKNINSPGVYVGNPAKLLRKL